MKLLLVSTGIVSLADATTPGTRIVVTLPVSLAAVAGGRLLLFAEPATRPRIIVPAPVDRSIFPIVCAVRLRRRDRRGKPAAEIYHISQKVTP